METWLEHNEWALFIILVLNFVFDYWLQSWKVKRREAMYTRLTRLEREVIIDALNTYSEVIAKVPEAFSHPLEDVADFLKNVDRLKDKLNV